MKTGIQFFSIAPCFRRDGVWIPTFAGMTINDFMDNKTYHINIRDNMLVFSTTSYKAEKGSILHSEIYNQDLSSSLAAGALTLLAVFFFALSFKITAIYIAAAFFLFIIAFLVLRKYVFREPCLILLIDREKGNITISLNAAIGSNKISLPVSQLKDINQGYVVESPENPDGVRLVEKVAAHHGTMIPGFGNASEFHTVELGLKDGRKFTIFSSEDKENALNIIIKIKDFIER